MCVKYILFLQLLVDFLATQLKYGVCNSASVVGIYMKFKVTFSNRLVVYAVACKNNHEQAFGKYDQNHKIIISVTSI